MCLQLQSEQGKNIVRIHSDHDWEFQNEEFNSLCDQEGILQEFSAPLTPR